MSKAEKLITAAARWVAVAGIAGLVLLSMGIGADIVLRLLADLPVSGLSDVQELAVAVLIAACFPVSLIRRDNLRIRVWAGLINRRASQALDLFGDVCLLAFFGLIAWQFVLLSIEYSATGQATSTVLLPRAPSWWVVTAIMILCAGAQALVVFSDLGRLVRGEPSRPSFGKPLPDDAGQRRT